MKHFFKFMKKRNCKVIFFLLFLLTLYVFVSAYSYVTAVSSQIEDSVFRLHVLANSNSKEDQDLKYKVRDALLEYMNTLCKDTTSKEDAMTIAKEHEQNFYQIAKNIISENGFSYDVNIQIGNFPFPTKQYGDISLPAGNYDALRVEIGDGIGQNWWCVMFPPLCFVDITSGIVPEESKEKMQDNLSDEEYNLISETETVGFKLKFRLIEFFQNSNLFTAKQ